MKLAQLFQDLHDGKLSLTQVSDVFGINERSLKIRLSKLGDRLPHVMETLDLIAEDWVSREQAAERMGVSVRDVTHLMSSYQVKRPLKEYLVNKERIQVKWKVRTKVAIDYIAGATTLEQAAEDAGCEDRTIRRWIIKLLHKHFEMPFKDLRLLSPQKARRIADSIAEAEGITIDTEQALKPVIDGKVDISDFARERVIIRLNR